MAADKKPRVRKIETVRERNDKAAARVKAQTSKVKKHPLKRVGGAIARPVARVVRPLAVRPVRFTLRWIGLILLPRYVRNAYKELKQVTWTTSRQTWKLTFAVLVFATVFGFLVAVTDFGLDKVIRRIVLR